MSDASLLALLVAVLSLLVAAASLAWSVSSWRRSGPLLRVHALLYDEELVIRVFNSGRAPDRIEQVVLGGSRRGHGGIDLTEALGGPVAVGPGESQCWRVGWRNQVPRDRHTVIQHGWESLWLLRGSMTEQRTEVQSQPGRVPPRSGWELAEAGSDRKRYVPLLMAVPLGAVALDAVSHRWQAWIFIAITIAVLAGMGLRWASRTHPIAARRRIEHALVIFGAAAILMAWGRRLDASGVIATYLLLAILLAVPGVISQLAACVREVREGARAKIESLGRGRVAHTASEERTAQRRGSGSS